MATKSSAKIGLVVLSTLLAGVLLSAVVLEQRDPNSPRVSVVRPRQEPPSLFTSIPRDTTPIDWQPWSEQTFETARRLGQPIAAFMDAAWCESCVLYAAALEATPSARGALENDVIPVRVDIDRRPDVHVRYHIHVSDLPTWILLSPSGELWDLHDALAFDPLTRALDELRRTPTPLVPDSGLEWLASSLPDEPVVVDLEGLPARLLDDLLVHWPASSDLLQPGSEILQWDALEFLRVYAEQTGSGVVRSLYLDTLRNLVSSSLLDPKTGAIEQELEPHPGRITRARFLATHAMLLMHFDRARSMSGDEVFTQAAQAMYSFLEETLFDPERDLFRSAQGTLVLREGRPVLTTGERQTMLRAGHAALPIPDPIPVFPIPGNARACVALLRHAETEQEGGPSRERAERVLARIRQVVLAAKRVPHDLAPDTTGALRASSQDFMIDYAELGLALLEANRSRSGPELVSEARALADTLLARFSDPERGYFYDIPAPDPTRTPARLRIRTAPLTDNARAAFFLVELARVTGDARYRDAARRALEAWSGSLGTAGPWPAAVYGHALLAVLQPMTP